MIGISVTLAAASIGSALGLMSGYFPRLDTLFMRTLDGLMAFPSILLAIAIMASLGTSAVNVFIALVVVYTPTIARLVRSTTLVTRQQPFVESARSIGMTDSQVLLRYVYPNGLSPLIVQCTFIVAFAIISEASLSFLGAGVDPETPTWGDSARRPTRPAECLVAGALPGHRPGAHGSHPQPPGGCTAGCLGSEGERTIAAAVGDQ